MRVSVWIAALAGAATLAASVPASAQIGPDNGAADTMGRRMIPQGGPAAGFGNRGGFRGNPGGFAGNRGGFAGDRGGFGRGGYAGYRHHDRGYGIGAGVAGLAAGALIGGAIASQASPGYGYGYGYDGGYGDPGYVPDYGYAPAPGYAYEPAAAAPVDDGDQQAYCAQRYKSYDPSSGTYLGYDGARHPCP